MSASFALQDRFLERFFAAPFSQQFYLTGGTALARFYFQHRESLDLDLFTEDQEQDFAQINQTTLRILALLGLQIRRISQSIQTIPKIKPGDHGFINPKSVSKFSMVKAVPWIAANRKNTPTPKTTR